MKKPKIQYQPYYIDLSDNRIFEDVCIYDNEYLMEKNNNEDTKYNGCFYSFNKYLSSLFHNFTQKYNL